MKINKVSIVKAGEQRIHNTIEYMNSEGWNLIGSVTSCLLDGGYTYYILTWEKEVEDG